MAWNDDPFKPLRDMFDATEALRHQLKAIDMFSPWRSMNDQLQSLLDMQKQLRRSGVLDIQEILRDSLALQLQEQIQYNFLHVQEQLRRSSAFDIQEALRESPIFQMREQIEQGLLGIQEQLRQSGALGIQEMLQEASAFRLQEQLQQGLIGFQEQFQRSGLVGLEDALKRVAAESLLSAISGIHNPLHRLRELAESLGQEDFDDKMLHIGPDGVITLGDETATAAEIERAFQEFFERFQDSLADIQSVLRRLQKPVRALILWFISNLFIPFLVSLYFQQQASLELREIQQSLELSESRTRQEVIAAIKKIKAGSSITGQGDYRVVTGDRVRIRSRPNRKASVKGLLPLGTVVHFLVKRGRWTAVEYVDPDTWFVENGWIFNKYLRKVDWRDRDKWDQQIEEDVRAGKLDKLAEEALAAHKTGKTKEF
jgi:hypothetical protein